MSRTGEAVSTALEAHIECRSYAEPIRVTIITSVLLVIEDEFSTNLSSSHLRLGILGIRFSYLCNFYSENFFIWHHQRSNRQREVGAHQYKPGH